MRYKGNIYILVIMAFQVVLYISVQGNPIVEYSQPDKPAIMVAEAVDVVVDEKKSEISGIYTFILNKRMLRADNSSNISIALPVLVKGEQNFKAIQSSANASVQIGDRVFYPDNLNTDYETSNNLPVNWKVCTLIFKVPKNVIDKEFDAKIHYTQINFPDKISVYLPIHPPQSKAIVRFTSKNSGSLSIVSRNIKTSDSTPGRINVRPEHDKLIQVRLHKP